MQKPIDRAVAKAELVRINLALREPHLLIGGLAVQQFHAARDSKDIDLVCQFETARELLTRLYSSRDWTVEDKQEDEYRPSYQIKHKVDNRGTIVFGPKILERAPYNHIDWIALKHGAQPFRTASGPLENILVPTAHALAYTKLISFLGRQSPEQKIEADLRDLVDLTNHSDFSASQFYDLLRKTRSFDELCASFRAKCDNYPTIIGESCLIDLSLMFAPARETTSERTRIATLESEVATLSKRVVAEQGKVAELSESLEAAGRGRSEAILIAVKEREHAEREVDALRLYAEPYVDSEAQHRCGVASRHVVTYQRGGHSNEHRISARFGVRLVNHGKAAVTLQAIKNVSVVLRWDHGASHEYSLNDVVPIQNKGRIEGVQVPTQGVHVHDFVLPPTGTVYGPPSTSANFASLSVAGTLVVNGTSVGQPPRDLIFEGRVLIPFEIGYTPLVQRTVDRLRQKLTEKSIVLVDANVGYGRDGWGWSLCIGPHVPVVLSMGPDIDLEEACGREAIEKIVSVTTSTIAAAWAKTEIKTPDSPAVNQSGRLAGNETAQQIIEWRKQCGEQLWAAVLALREAIPRAFFDLDVLTEDEYATGVQSNAIVREHIQEITEETIARGIFFRDTGSNVGIEAIRPIIGESLWQRFVSYQAFLARSCLVVMGKFGMTGPWYKDPLVLRLLGEALTREHVAQMQSLSIAKMNFARTQVEAVILDQIRAMLPNGTVPQ